MLISSNYSVQNVRNCKHDKKSTQAQLPSFKGLNVDKATKIVKKESDFVKSLKNFKEKFLDAVVPFRKYDRIKQEAMDDFLKGIDDPRDRAIARNEFYECWDPRTRTVRNKQYY